MHRAFRMAALVGAGVVLIAAGIAGYAAYNLTSLVARNQDLILGRIGRAVGRPVKVAAIKAKFGLGLAIEIDGLAIADDSAFSRDPFFTAAQTALNVRVIPLLHGTVKVHRLELTQPVVRVLRRADGRLNLDTLGEMGGGPVPPRNAANAMRGVVWAIARDLSIKALAIDDGTLFYRDVAASGTPLQIAHLSAEMDGQEPEIRLVNETACAAPFRAEWMRSQPYLPLAFLGSFRSNCIPRRSNFGRSGKILTLR